MPQNVQRVCNEVLGFSSNYVVRRGGTHQQPWLQEAEAGASLESRSWDQVSEVISVYSRDAVNWNHRQALIVAEMMWIGTTERPCLLGMKLSIFIFLCGPYWRVQAYTWLWKESLPTPSASLRLRLCKCWLWRLSRCVAALQAIWI